MPQSLRCKLRKLCHDGKISSEELLDLLSKLDGHDAKTRADAIDECIKTIIEFQSWPHTVCNILEMKKDQKND